MMAGLPNFSSLSIERTGARTIKTGEEKKKTKKESKGVTKPSTPSRRKAQPDGRFRCDLNRYSVEALPVLDLNEEITQDEAKIWYDVAHKSSDQMSWWHYEGAYSEVRRVYVRSYVDRPAIPKPYRCNDYIIAVKWSTLEDMEGILMAFIDYRTHLKIYESVVPNAHKFFVRPFEMELPIVRMVDLQQVRHVIDLSTLDFWIAQYDKDPSQFEIRPPDGTPQIRYDPPEVEFYTVQQFAAPEGTETRTLTSFVVEYGVGRYNTVETATVLGGQFGEALAYLHMVGIVHDDTHGGNLLVVFPTTPNFVISSLQLKVIDFGTARQASPEPEASFELLAIDLFHRELKTYPPFMLFDKEEAKYAFYDATVRSYARIRAIDFSSFPSAEEAVTLYNRYPDALGGMVSNGKRRWTEFNKLMEKLPEDHEGEARPSSAND